MPVVFFPGLCLQSQAYGVCALTSTCLKHSPCVCWVWLRSTPWLAQDIPYSNWMRVLSLVPIDPLTCPRHSLLQLNACAEVGSASEVMTYCGIERCILVLSLLLNVCTEFGSDRPLDFFKTFPTPTECVCWVWFRLWIYDLWWDRKMYIIIIIIECVYQVWFRSTPWLA